MQICPLSFERPPFRKCQDKGQELHMVSNFCACHNFYFHIYPCLNPFPNKPWFLRVCNTSLLKTLWEKEKLLVTSNFSFSHSAFYPFGKLSAILIRFQIVFSKLFDFWKSLTFVVWERVKLTAM